MRESKTCPDQEWKQLPTDELDRILQAELEKKYPNEEVVLPILQTLEDREKDYPVEETPEVLALLEKLSEHKTPPKQSKSKRRWITGIAAVAAAACIIVMAVPRTVGAESVFDILSRWTSEVFEFFTPDQDKKKPPAEYLFETDNNGLQQLYDKVVELGITEPVVPMWLPEGFELLNLKATPLRDNGYKVNAIFRGNEKGVSITYRISNDITTKFEKEETAVELYDYADVSHFVLVNDENLSVTWAIDGVECLINTDVSREDVYIIIKSIYRRPLE
ncbi:MAG: DUF4367 domain-containing protein [Oscillospiraceae bacterium]|nr:DUF4367 domain-containing protein [Oscillospiraceae bacterium]